ncbi:MAG: electron transport complex subunit E [Gammaproteobacteria bacterium]|nr:electron transport complex subunit E [Gammaproteobacteria bacterium]
MSHDYRRISKDGLWDNNIVFAQALGLCPLLAVTGTASNGLGMGLASTAVFVASALMISLLRNIITPQVRIPIFVLIIAVLVTLVDMGMNAWVHDLHKVLGLFIPLIVTNCAILGRAEAFASRNSVLPAVVDGIMMGLGFTLALVALGAVREVLGSGTLFSSAALLLGDWAAFLDVQLIADYKGFLLIILPPGGFIVLAFLLAGKRLIDRSLAARNAGAAAQAAGI